MSAYEEAFSHLGQSSGGGNTLASLLRTVLEQSRFEEQLRQKNLERQMTDEQSQYKASLADELFAPLTYAGNEDLNAIAGAPNQYGTINPMLAPGFQSMVNVQRQMLESGDPQLQEAVLKNFGQQFGATVPKAPEYRDPRDAMTSDIKNYEYAKAQGFPGTFQQYIEFDNMSKKMEVNVGGTNVNNYPKADDAYMQQRGKGEAETFNTLTAAADSAYRQKQSLDQFINASANGFEGGAADMLSGAANLFSSFGINLAPDQLKDTRLMEQAVGNILGTKMAELGARGLTDRDMAILREALPRVETDKASRVAVAQILQKANDATINQYKQRVEHEQIKYPENNFYYHPWLKDWKPGTTTPSSSAPVKVNSPEEAAALPPGTKFIAPDGSMRTRK